VGAAAGVEAPHLSRFLEGAAWLLLLLLGRSGCSADVARALVLLAPAAAAGGGSG
jgi:hypothetical protein